MTDVLSPAEDRARTMASVPETPARPQLVSVRADPASQPTTTATSTRLANLGSLDRSQELALMRAVAAHDPQAEAELARRVMPLVRSRVRALTRSKPDAEDATQTAVVEILRSAPNYRGEGSLAGWCERITVRTALRMKRRQDRAGASIDSSVQPEDVGAVAPEPVLAERIPGGEVEAYLAELSEDRHRALVLRHVLGLSVEEIADQTGVSPNTVKDRLRMARKQVRQSIRQREVIGAARRGRS